jgi:hypothetical protein
VKAAHCKAAHQVLVEGSSGTNQHPSMVFASKAKQKAEPAPPDPRLLHLVKQIGKREIFSSQCAARAWACKEWIVCLWPPISLFPLPIESGCQHSSTSDRTTRKCSLANLTQAEIKREKINDVLLDCAKTFEINTPFDQLGRSTREAACHRG